MAEIKCFWLEDTGRRHLAFVDGRAIEVDSIDELAGWQSAQPIYRRVDTGEQMLWRNAPAGAMRDAVWLQYDGLPLYGEEDTGNPRGWWRGPDNRVLQVKTPGGDWIIDSRASNCDLPKDNAHRCWCRTGTPPDITVDKNGVTCGAGAGSIQCRDYHGHLVKGYLVDA